MKTEIDKFNPCRDGVDFRKRFKTFEEAWSACERGDWMLWIAAKLEVDIRILTLAKGLCANTVKHLMKDKRSTAAVDAAIAFGNGEIDANELKTTVSAAATAYTAAKKHNQKRTADICREVLTNEVFRLINEL